MPVYWPISVAEAAKRMQVSPGRVRELIREGRIEARQISGVWLVNSLSLHGARQVTRPLSGRNARALIFDDFAHLTSQEERVLRQRVAALKEVEYPEQHVRAWLANRSIQHEMYAPEPQALAEDKRVVLGGLSDPRSLMASYFFVEAYVHEDDFQALCHEHVLFESPTPNARVHVLPYSIPDPLPDLVAVADLATYPGAREQGAAARIIQEYLHRLP